MLRCSPSKKVSKYNKAFQSDFKGRLSLGLALLPRNLSDSPLRPAQIEAWPEADVLCYNPSIDGAAAKSRSAHALKRLNADVRCQRTGAVRRMPNIQDDRGGSPMANDDEDLSHDQPTVDDPEVFISSLVSWLQANDTVDPALVEILSEHILKAEPEKDAVDKAAVAMWQLAADPDLGADDV